MSEAGPTLPERYVLAREIDPPRGGVRRVLAFDVSLQQEVVVSTFRAGEAERRRFLAEAALARELSGPELTLQLGAGDQGEGSYLASEVLLAPNLRQLLMGPRLPPSMAAQLEASYTGRASGGATGAAGSAVGAPSGAWARTGAPARSNPSPSRIPRRRDSSTLPPGIP